MAGAADGIGAAAQFNQPGAIAIDPQGNVFHIADAGAFAVFRLSAAGMFSVVAGQPRPRSCTR